MFLFIFILHSCLYFYFDIFLYLNDDVTIKSLPLIDRFVLVELENYTDLRFVLHRQQEPFHYIFVVDHKVVGLSMESEVFLIEVDCIFTSWDRQIDLIESQHWLTGKGTDFGFFYNFLIHSLSKTDFVFLIFVDLLGLLGLFTFLRVLGIGLVFLFRDVNIEADLTHTILIIFDFGPGFDDNVILVDGGIVDRLVVDREDWFRVVIHCAKLQRGLREI